MRKSRFSEAQIVNVLKELAAGRPAVELARKHGVHINTLRLWRSKYGGLETSDLVRLKELEAENSEMEPANTRGPLARWKASCAPAIDACKFWSL